MRSLASLFTIPALIATVVDFASSSSISAAVDLNMTATADDGTASAGLISDDVTCQLLETAGFYVYRPNSTVYQQREADYYSASAVLHPTCIVQPTSAADVSKIITTLVGGTSSNWAVRSGGHTAWGPAADIHNGVTIDLGLMNKTTYDLDSKIASFGAGSLWQDVYGSLEAYGVTVPGGRTATVGVGGFTLGGGNNFFSGKVGFACDNVVNYEVVLADGAIVQANAAENPDLWKALKGGSSNFGIVTRFDMKAFEVGNLYGGLLTHPLTATDQIIRAFSNFVDNIENYQAGSAFTFWSWVQGATESVINSALHDTSGTVNASAYAEYAAIEPVIASSLREDSHLNMTKELNFAKGFQNVWFAITVGNDPEILAFIVDQHNAFTASWPAETGDDTFSLYTVFQPLPKILFDHGVEQGGNVFMVFSGDAALEAEARRRLVAYRETVKARSVELGVGVEFEYLNYADKTQSPLATYGEDNIAFMRRVAAQYDPKGIWRTRMPGGFKLP
ncbi:6-hydroxy-D-nicotine oxidase [Xylariomycetidae sp. FL2044]|nr:6-hydroxy-D-nicotine oxidase [Xylariomycetidae sp. FL2044]